MAFLYYTIDKQPRGFYNGIWIAHFSIEKDPKLDPFVGTLLRVDDILEESVELAEDIDEINVFCNMTETGIITSENSGTFKGVVIQGGPEGSMGRVICTGNITVRAGEVDLPVDSSITAGPGGVAVPFDDTGIVHITAGKALADLDNSVWGDGDTIHVATSVDDADARGMSVGFTFLNENGILDSEAITLDADDSSVVVSGLKTCTILLDVMPNSEITTALVTLDVSNSDTDSCVSLLTPSIGSVGMVEADVEASNGHLVSLTSDTDADGTVVLLGKSSDGTVVSDIIPVSGKTATSNRAFAELNAVYLGGDGATDAEWVIEVKADTGTAIATNPVAAISANLLGLVSLA